MHYSDYLREQAVKYWQLAEAAEEAFVKHEFLELAAEVRRWRMRSTTAGQVDDRDKWSKSVHLLAERPPPRRPFDPYREFSISPPCAGFDHVSDLDR